MLEPLASRLDYIGYSSFMSIILVSNPFPFPIQCAGYDLYNLIQTLNGIPEGVSVLGVAFSRFYHLAPARLVVSFGICSPERPIRVNHWEVLCRDGVSTVYR